MCIARYILYSRSDCIYAEMKIIGHVILNSQETSCVRQGGNFADKRQPGRPESDWPSVSCSTWYSCPVYRILEVVDGISDKHFPVMPHSSNTDVIKAFEKGSNSLQFLAIQVRIHFLYQTPNDPRVIEQVSLDEPSAELLAPRRIWGRQPLVEA
jgi:hypothetical protein